MKNLPRLYIYNSLIFIIIYTTPILSLKPKLTVIFVIDQCPYSAITKQLPFMHYGIKEILDKGAHFSNAHHDHGMPATGTGHTGLNTGAFANEHGIIGNRWFNKQGKKVVCDEGDPITCAVLSPEGTYNYGKSPYLIMVDGISDQFVLSSSPGVSHRAASVSGKGRSAIATANRTEAYWLEQGQLTSSKAYFDTLPTWVQDFNSTHAIPSPSTITWKQCYDNESGAYNFNYIDDYRFTRKQPLVNKTLSIGIEAHPKKPFVNFELSPSANTFVADAAIRCMEEYVSADKPDRLLLWVCLSSLDKVGHRFGPWSREYIDMLYHLDKEIGRCMDIAKKLVGSDDVLFVLTSDHGVPPLIEHIHEKGFTHLGHLINSNTLIEEINKFIQERYNVENIAYATSSHQIYLNMPTFRTLPLHEQKNIIKDLQEFLEEIPGIKKVWTPQALLKRSFPLNSMEFCFQQQFFPGRSGDLILQTFPYTLITSHKQGTSHRTPHTHNTHVPLALYGNAITQPKKIPSRVLTLQLANTLAELLEVPQPSSSYLDVLPHVIP